MKQNFQKNVLFILGCLLIIILVAYTFSDFIKEGLTGSSTTCAQRSTCSACLNGYDSTGSTCYWCGESKKCNNPDLFYDYTICSRDKAKCTS